MHWVRIANTLERLFWVFEAMQRGIVVQLKGIKVLEMPQRLWRHKAWFKGGQGQVFWQDGQSIMGNTFALWFIRAYCTIAPRGVLAPLLWNSTSADQNNAIQKHALQHWKNLLIYRNLIIMLCTHVIFFKKLTKPVILTMKVQSPQISNWWTHHECVCKPGALAR